MKTALEYGRLACDTMINRYGVNGLPPQKYGHATFNYQQGVLLSGVASFYEQTKDERYLDYVLAWAREIQDEKGEIREYNDWISRKSLDFRQGGYVLAYLFEKTGDEHDLQLVKWLVESMDEYPVNRFGGFWHMSTTPNQMWLDGLYMVGPLMTRYARLSGRDEYLERAVRQAEIMYDHMRLPENGLLSHGWDPEKEAEWADPVTGRSSQVWGRACGWFVAAIADMLDDVPQGDARRERLLSIQRPVIEAILHCQSDEGRWYQVPDQWQREGNWPETSCTSLFVYAICKGVRNGYLPREAYACARRAYERVMETLLPAPDGEIRIGGICTGTCIDEGTYDHYIQRPQKENGIHGMGVFIRMTTEMACFEGANA